VPEALSGGDPRWVGRACEQSLSRLGGESIDLYLLHRPDPQVPIADTLAAMNRLIDEGKVREIGCSNFSAAQLVEAHAAARDRGLRGFACVQNEYNLLHRTPQAEVLATCASLAMAFVPYFPHIEAFTDPTTSDESIRQRFFGDKKVRDYLPGDTRQWSLSEARRLLRDKGDWRQQVRRCLYRPFDVRWVLYDARMVDWPRPEVLGEMLAPNRCLVVNR
jgi:aryl-alcohol dehydrogenase-like predicted oxidoreductase